MSKPIALPAAVPSFAEEARRLATCRIATSVPGLGGYGAGGDVIYERHPDGCPSVLVDSRGGAVATFLSNGGVGFTVRPPEFEVEVLRLPFDAVEKQETGVPSANAWLAVRSPSGPFIVSLHNAMALAAPHALRIVKVASPCRAMWFLADYRPGRGIAFRTALRLSLVQTPAGPALLRQVLIENSGRTPLDGRLWTWWNLRGTQEFVYNKSIWYDAGMPLSPVETVVAASVPFRDMLQVKRISSACSGGLRPDAATCDYSAFVGGTAASAVLPEAVRRGRLAAGAGVGFNRFSTPTGSANGFAMRLAPGATAQLEQSLLYVTDPEVLSRFGKARRAARPSYRAIAGAFRSAARGLVAATPDVRQAVDLLSRSAGAGSAAHPSFQVDIPAAPAIAAYANSVWAGVPELYENCRAHGAKMAQGIELGTRDRCQDMWPKMKDDPGRVRADLVHACGFMYRTVSPRHRWSKPLTRIEKLHGMFPRQLPSRWDDRRIPVRNDNRPYNDSAVWLVDALNLYVRETGDMAILTERVGTVRLTDPQAPEQSAMVGADLQLSIAEVLLGIFETYGRHIDDSPYRLVQVMYGDWCDPIDMFGTSVVGDSSTRGNGRGVQVRLSCHVFASLVESVDLLEAAASRLPRAVKQAVPRLRQMADGLRRRILEVAWEGGTAAGFVAAIHEHRADGSNPEGPGGRGYTLGSMTGSDFDGLPRRELTVQAWGVRMLQVERSWLTPVPDAAARVAALLKTCNARLFAPKLGLALFRPAIANDARACRLAGRMGILPAGCAENGEYHHGQIMMHRFRLQVPGEVDAAWRQFGPMVSAMRDASLAGPFEMPATSYAADPDDPHFGKGMYFGLSGSTDWIIEFLQELAGLELALHDPRQPALRVTPRLPAALEGQMTLRRVIHAARPAGGYRAIPLTLALRPANGRPGIRINGRAVTAAEVPSLDGLEALLIEVDA